MSLATLWKTDRTLRWALAAALVAGLAMAGRTLTQPNQYRSEVLVLPKGGAGGPLAALAATAEFFGGWNQIDEEAHYTDILESRWLAENLLATRYRFRFKPRPMAAREERDQTLAEFLEVRDAVDRETALGQVQNMVRNRRDLKTGMLRVTVVAPSPELAKQIADQAVLLLGKALKERAQARNAAKAGYASVRLASARTVEEEARQALAAYARNHVNYATSADAGIRSQGERLNRDLALKSHLVDSLSLAFEQAELESRNTVPVLSTLGEAFLPATKAGPRRVRLVLMAALLAGAGTWLAFNFRKVRARLRQVEAGRSQYPAAEPTGPDRAAP